MRPVSQALESHLSKDATTVCYCWIVRRRDGVVTGYTDHDRTLQLDDVACAPSSGFAAGAVETSLGLSGDTSDVAGALSDRDITEEDIAAGRYDNAIVEHYLVNWQVPQERMLLSRARIGEITQEGRAFKVELRSMVAALDQVRGRSYLADCDADLGDTRCRFDLNAEGYTATATVVSANDRQVIQVDGMGAFPDQWFVNGRLVWQSGALAGTASLVTATRPDSTSGHMRVTLFEPLPVMPQPGDEAKITAGCDKRFATCKAKFANQNNFRGFPHMPGSERALTYVGSGQEFDGRPLVP